jgi:hypothetical protein
MKRAYDGKLMVEWKEKPGEGVEVVLMLCWHCFVQV